MLRKTGIFIFVGIKLVFANNITMNTNQNDNMKYVIPLKIQKSKEINNALKIKQYLYDLKKLNQILYKLYSNKIYYTTSTSLESTVKKYNYYTFDYIFYLLKILNGTDPYNTNILLKNKGYIQDVINLYNNYQFYLYNINTNNKLINKSFDFIENEINKNLLLLEKKQQHQKNIRPVLKNIMFYLIKAIEEIERETKDIETMDKNKNVILFNKILNQNKILDNLKYYYNTVYNIDKPFYLSY